MRDIDRTCDTDVGITADSCREKCRCNYMLGKVVLGERGDNEDT